MCSYEIGHSNNPAIKQSTYKWYQPKIYSAQISSPSPPQQSKALLQRDKGKPFLFIALDSPECLSQVCLPPRNTSTWNSWGAFPPCSNRSEDERVMGKKNFYISLLGVILQSISLDQSLWILFPLPPPLPPTSNEMTGSAHSSCSVSVTILISSPLYNLITKNSLQEIGLLEQVPNHNSNPFQSNHLTCIYIDPALCEALCWRMWGMGKE